MNATMLDVYTSLLQICVWLAITMAFVAGVLVGHLWGHPRKEN